MRNVIRTAGLAVALVAMAASSAYAATGPAMLTTASPVGTASNTGAISGNTASYPRHTLGVSGATFACNDVTFRVTAVATSSATIDPSLTACSMLISNVPVGAATFDTPCDWSLSFANATFDTATGASTGETLTTNCSTTMTLPFIGCTVHFPAQTRSGITAQSITSFGTATNSPTPWGSTVNLNLAGLAYTSSGSCPIPASGTFQYLGEVAVRNLWAML